ncbi:metallophosphoesterase [Thalassoporum mexicanum PCC 7367]|uniref:3',5'-cyclic-AMP phosphodiesterase n=1 Tax=Thalassoporum mexicanum TaxID=3457544 RepID=UPI00029FA181|nr:3',5'-cyclic-AMP phosphodiesterase [Pseudanabaena sp. PCC 7367]AFY70711.1 metallophosphoesterase [Pseudanabaena sp. PCC 7367]
MTGTPQITIAQITDIHLFDDSGLTLKGIDTNSSFQAVLAAIANLEQQPDLLLVTGDLTQDGLNHSYQRLHHELSHLSIPAYCIPGNHDSAELVQNFLADMAAIDRRLVLGNWQILLLNSAVPGQVHGHLADATLQWLECQLEANPDLNTLIALHHPALAIDSEWMDMISLQNRDQFWQICDRYPQIKAVIAGHAHQDIDAFWQGKGSQQIRHLVTPSTCVQFAPQKNCFALDYERSPGFRLLYLYGDGRVETEVKRLPQGKFVPTR